MIVSRTGDFKKLVVPKRFDWSLLFLRGNNEVLSGVAMLPFSLENLKLSLKSQVKTLRFETKILDLRLETFMSLSRV